MSDDIRPTNQIIYGVDIYDASHAALVDTSGNIKVVDQNTARIVGTWAYYSGLNGTVTIASGQRVLSISCHATNVATLTINGGSTVTIPPNCGFSSSPEGNLVAPVLVFTNTDAYFVEVVY